MSVALQNLNFIVSLTDRMSAPMGNIMRSMDGAKKQMTSGTLQMGAGVAGLVGLGYTMQQVIDPARELNKALLDVKSLDVTGDALDMLRERALKFSQQYGESAIDFIKSSYDIQSSITGLTADELAGFTEKSAILAKGTKASAMDVTNFVGTMYGIFQKQADAMGKINWIDQLAGQSALAVKLFKTTGTGMAEAFTSLGAAGQNSKIAMSEQIAILGTLQATMSGSEAGTKYRSFLDNVGKAQKALNLVFVDANGSMLPILDILTRIKDKFGDIDTVAESDLLKKAFGTEESVALIKLLSTNLDGLNGSIGQIGDVKGIQGAIDMATKITDPWDKLKEGVTAAKVALAQPIVSEILPWLETLNTEVFDIIASINKWQKINPQLSQSIVGVIFGVTALLAGMAALTMVMGAVTTIGAGFSLAWAGIAFILTPLAPLLTAIRVAWVLSMAQMAAGMGTFTALRFGLSVFTAQLWLNVSALWAWAAALWANPITWIVAGIVGLIAVVALAVIHWDEWTAAVIKYANAFGEWSGIYGIVDGVTSKLDSLGAWWDNFDPLGSMAAGAIAADPRMGTYVENMKSSWMNFKLWLSEINPLDALSLGNLSIGDGALAGIDTIKSGLSDFTAWLSEINPFGSLNFGSVTIGDDLLSGIDTIKTGLTDFTIWLSSINIFESLAFGAVSTISWILSGIESIKTGWFNAKLWLAGIDPFSALAFGAISVVNWILSGIETVKNGWFNAKLWLAGIDPFSALAFGAISVVNWILSGIETVKNGWFNTKLWLAGLNPFGGLLAGAISVVASIVASLERIKGWWAGFKGWLSGLNPFAGIASSLNGLMAKVAGLSSMKISIPSVMGARGTVPAAGGKGGLLNKISSSISNSSSKNTTVNVHNHGTAMSGARLANEMAMAGG